MDVSVVLEPFVEKSVLSPTALPGLLLKIGCPYKYGFISELCILIHLPGLMSIPCYFYYNSLIITLLVS